MREWPSHSLWTTPGSTYVSLLLPKCRWRPLPVLISVCATANSRLCFYSAEVHGCSLHSAPHHPRPDRGQSPVGGREGQNHTSTDSLWSNITSITARHWHNFSTMLFQVFRPLAWFQKSKVRRCHCDVIWVYKDTLITTLGLLSLLLAEQYSIYVPWGKKQCREDSG